MFFQQPTLAPPTNQYDLGYPPDFLSYHPTVPCHSENDLLDTPSASCYSIPPQLEEPMDSPYLWPYLDQHLPDYSSMPSYDMPFVNSTQTFPEAYFTPPPTYEAHTWESSVTHAGHHGRSPPAGLSSAALRRRKPYIYPPPNRASSNRLPQGESVTCELLVNDVLCREEFSIASGDVSGLRWHLEFVHGIGKGRSKKQIDCTWRSCSCSAQGSRHNRCADRPATHAAHVTDLADHIWSSHLHFRYDCKQCGCARWSTAFARDRHQSTCEGGSPVRCPSCCHLSGSEREHTRHVCSIARRH